MGSPGKNLPCIAKNPFSLSDRNLYLLPDPPHLIKTTRNCIYGSRRSDASTRMIHRNGKYILWEHFCYVESKNVKSCLHLKFLY